jgi:hypothetical protein
MLLARICSASSANAVKRSRRVVSDGSMIKCRGETHAGVKRISPALPWRPRSACCVGSHERTAEGSMCFMQLTFHSDFSHRPVPAIGCSRRIPKQEIDVGGCDSSTQTRACVLSRPDQSWTIFRVAGRKLNVGAGGLRPRKADGSDQSSWYTSMSATPIAPLTPDTVAE